MYLEKRPTSVTVIGWAWIVIGALMLFSAVMALLASMLADDMIRSHGGVDYDMPLMFRLFPVIAVVQIGFATLGVVAGINFLRLKPWSRTVLEAQTWILLVFLVGFMVFWMISWTAMTSAVATDTFSMMGLVMGFVIMAIYAIPLGFMLRSLRGEKVRNALKDQ